MYRLATGFSGSLPTPALSSSLTRRTLPFRAEFLVGLVQDVHEALGTRIHTREQVALDHRSCREIQQANAGFLVAVSLLIHRPG